jgi:hypothetical protein
MTGWSNSIRNDAMPPPPNTDSPAALVNFIFRQLPDDVLDEIIQAAGASGVPLEGVISVVGGSAVAAGQDTVTIGLVQNLAEDSSLPLPHGVGEGGYTIIVGDAIFVASAQAPEAGEVDAAANTFMAVSGADIIIIDESSDGSWQANDAWASSELSYIALNINGWSPEGGPLVYELELNQPGDQVRPDEHQPPDGNYAAVIATAEAHGADSSVSAAQTYALTVENQFSFVTAIAVVAV